MRVAGLIVVSVLAAALSASGCSKKESTVDKAVDNTKDALNMRDHEKLKDAGEDAKDAAPTPHSQMAAITRCYWLAAASPSCN